MKIKWFMRRLSMAFVAVLAFAAVAGAQADLVILQSVQNGKYAGFTDRGFLAAGETAARAKRFEMVRLQGNRVAFRDPGSGRYLRAGVTQGTLLALGEGRILGWETFELGRAGGDQTLRSVQNGKYVRAGIGPATLFGAVSDRVGGWERFRIVSVSGAEPGAPLAGTWRVMAIYYPGDQRIWFDAAAMAQTRFSVAPDGRFTMTAGCNTLGGTVRQRGDFISTSGIVSTKMLCNTPGYSIERSFTDALAAAARVSIRPDTMVMEDAQGRRLMTFQRL